MKALRLQENRRMKTQDIVASLIMRTLLKKPHIIKRLNEALEEKTDGQELVRRWIKEHSFCGLLS